MRRNRTLGIQMLRFWDRRMCFFAQELGGASCEGCQLRHSETYRFYGHFAGLQTRQVCAFSSDSPTLMQSWTLDKRRLPLVATRWYLTPLLPLVSVCSLVFVSFGCDLVSNRSREISPAKTYASLASRFWKNSTEHHFWYRLLGCLERQKGLSCLSSSDCRKTHPSNTSSCQSGWVNLWSGSICSQKH